MTLAYPLLNELISFSENRINVLIIENAAELRRFLLGLRQQLHGLAGDLVLAENFVPVDFSKSAQLVTDPFSLELDSRKLLAKINQDACAAGVEYADEFCSIIFQLNSLAQNISASLTYDTAFEPLESWDELIKLFGFYVDTQQLSFPEQLLEYIRLHRTFFQKKLFVFYNLKACLNSQELALLYRSLCYEKLNVLLVEDIQRETIGDYEKIVLVDKDLCIF